MRIVSIRIETICKKCHILFFGTNKKYFKILSTEICTMSAKR